MGVIDFAEYVKAAIEAGTSVEGNVVRIIADNGDEIGEAVFKVIQGGNGTASEIGIATQTGASGAVATGVAYLALDVGVVGAAIAPALGIVAGVGLYNLAPEFWNGLSESLINAGQTVAGKVIGYWNGDNLHLSQQTIEIFKNKLLEAGVFDTPTKTEGDSWSQEQSWYEDIVFPIPFSKGQCNIGSGPRYDYSLENSDAIAIGMPFNLNQFGVRLVSLSNPTVIRELDRLTMEVRYITHESSPIIMNGKSFYHSYIGPFEYQYSKNQPPNYGFWESGDVANIEYCALFGEGSELPDVPKQPDATYPDATEFPLTYPLWFPLIYPQTLPDPSTLPTVFPLKYPEIDPNPYPDQEGAQDPDAEEAPEVYPEIDPDFDIPSPGLPEPGPEPEPDPDPSAEDPDPIDEGTDIEIDDPVDPNPGPTGGETIVVPNLPNTVSSNKLFTVYNPGSSQLDSLGGYLWDQSLMATLRDIWQDPLDGIISLIQVFATPTTGSNHNIILGFLDSGISCPVVTSQFVTVDCGSVTIEENKKNATDYSPYSEIHLFLPFIGIVELDVNECMGGTIGIKYNVDVYTGTCLAQVSITRDADMPHATILYTFSGNCSQQIPLTSGNAVGLLQALVGCISTGLSVPSGGGLTLATGAKMLGESMQHDLYHVSHSGNISANAGIMGQKKPYVIISRRHCYDANNYSAVYGFPANVSMILGNHTGFIRVKKCWIKTSALQEEYNEIMRILEEDGVFM